MKIGRSKQKEVTHIIWRTGNAYTFKKKYRITGLSSLPPSYYFFFSIIIPYSTRCISSFHSRKPRSQISIRSAILFASSILVCEKNGSSVSHCD